MIEHKQFWHMQMHPEYTEFFDKYGRLIVEHLNLIGLGDEDEQSDKVRAFSHDMQVGDIVALRKGKKLTALVEITSPCYKVQESESSKLSWLEFRHNVKVLDWNDDREIPVAQGTLKRCVSDDVETTRVIKGWFEDIHQCLQELNIKI